MNTLHRKQWAITSVFTTIVIVISATFTLSLHAKTLQDTFAASSGGGLQIKTDVGKINVITHDNPSVLVNVEIEGQNKDDFSVEFIPKNGNLQIIGERTNSNSNWGWKKQLRISFNITVPSKYNIQLNTSGGSVNITDLTGNIDAYTSGGSIGLGNIVGNVQAKTSGGTIKVGNVAGNVLLYTSGGSIEATLPPQIQVNLKASTSGGRVSSDFLVNGEISKRKVEGEINGGGPKLILHTSGGNIKIIKSNNINNLM